jgi:hypothetical protein
MKTTNFFLIFLMSYCISFSENTAFAVGPLNAGTAKVNLTPAEPKKPVHDSLYARSLILDVDGNRVAFVSLDVISYTNEKLSERLRKKYNLQEIFYCASHTHSGVEPRDFPQWFEDRITESVHLASENMFEARISAGHRSFPQLGFNRLVVREDGWAREIWKYDDHYLEINTERRPFGPVDPAVGVIKVEDTSGNTRVIVMNYACHDDAVWSNFKVSADWVGVATRLTEDAYDKKVNCLFVNGGAGNIAPMFKDPGRKSPDDPRETDYNLIERMGKLLSIEAVKLAKNLRYDPEEIPGVQVKTDSMSFTGRFDKNAKYSVHFATLYLNSKIAIATFPGEPFIKFQLDWKEDLKDEAIPFFFGYVWNGGMWPIYVPDIKSAALGGFGADQGPTFLEVGAGEAIMNKHLEDFYILNGRMRSKPGPTN